MTKSTVRKLAISALFLAIGMVLPSITGLVRVIGNMLLPMHIPVMLCGIICGWQFGGAIGIMLPILRSLIFTMPPMYPNACAMAVELCTYGVVIGIVYKLVKDKKGGIFIALIVSMLSGRIMWGIAISFLTVLAGGTYTFAMYFTRAFIEAIPGLIIQLILIPTIIIALRKAKMIE
ncbi:MAG: ECF transporter S component [Acutalibacteraceae bacterium]|nr:ECF transporter S component [Acutalibacteraceae bacterium]